MKIGIIGTAGRVLDAKRLTAAHFTAMCAHTEKMLIAYTFGTGSQPKEESGTRHCWEHSTAPIKIHVPLGSIFT